MSKKKDFTPEQELIFDLFTLKKKKRYLNTNSNVSADC